LIPHLQRIGVYDEFKLVLADYEDKGFIRRVDQDFPKHFIPLGVVVKKEKVTSKVRPILDCKASKINRYLSSGTWLDQSIDLTLAVWRTSPRFIGGDYPRRSQVSRCIR